MGSESLEHPRSDSEMLLKSQSGLGTRVGGNLVRTEHRAGSPEGAGCSAGYTGRTGAVG